MSSNTSALPVPRPRPKPAYALVKIGTRKFKARILWDQWDSRKPDVFAVLGPRDVVIQCRRAQMTMLP